MNTTELERSLCPADLLEIEARGVSVEEIEWQHRTLLEAPAPRHLERAATVGDGIVSLDAEACAAFERRGAAAAARGEVTKFVPASGAASRMFADLAAALDDDDLLDSEPIERFVRSLDQFPFAAQLREAGIPSGLGDRDSRRRLVATALRSSGIGLAAMPKGVVPFHRYGDRVTTAIGEHIREGRHYATDSHGVERLHLTVAPDARKQFEEVVAREAKEAGVSVELELSVQDPATDTIAVDDDGELFRDGNGVLLWRPGGHGSLLRNLAGIATRYAVIKNVDNVRREEHQALIGRWKRILVGMLDELRETVHSHLESIRSGDASAIIAAAEFAYGTFGRRVDDPSDPEQVAQALDRPLRVCGVVRNEGEPGGAPFWVRRGGEVTLQIVESAEVDQDDPQQRKVFESATHFNPVDLAVSLRDSRGVPYVLDRFVDRSAVFRAEKSHEGRRLRALERPGLWNGAMAGWNSLCVEVPSDTFAPVKTVFDLLRREHQPE